MSGLKDVIANSSVIFPINYALPNEVILSVDSSHIAVNYVLVQLDDNGHHRPAHFDSIFWNEHELHYLQAKLNLYSLFCALKAVKIWIIGIKNLIVKVDTQYIKGMINNPDIQPNTSMNHWLTSIQTFNFKLWHVSTSKH